MKTCIFLFCLFLTACSIHLKKSHLVTKEYELSSKSSYDEYVEKLTHEIELTDDFKLLDYSIPISSFLSFDKTLTPKNLKWNRVIYKFNQNKNKASKFIQLRFEDIIYTIRKILRIENKFQQCETEPSSTVLIGTLKQFETDCVSVNISGVPGLTINGKYMYSE
jgi:hypothetical protein